MKTIKSITESYVKKSAIADAVRSKIDQRIIQRELQIRRLKNKLGRLVYVSWVEEIIRPIAELLIKKQPDRTYDILGPFGLTAETSIHFYKKGVTEKNRFNGDNCRSISFQPVNLSIGEIVLTDRTADTGEFKSGTIGEMNGMNHPTIPMKKTIDELFDWMNNQNKRKGK